MKIASKVPEPRSGFANVAEVIDHRREQRPRARFDISIDGLQRCLDFVLASCQESGLIASDSNHAPMYGHGFATLFLAEVYGMTGDDRVKEKLQKAVKLIERTQNNEGGWSYMPVPYDADISVTICQVMALRAARDAGIKVEKDVIDKSIKYVISCQNPDGGFSYQSPRSGGGSHRCAPPRAPRSECPTCSS